MLSAGSVSHGSHSESGYDRLRDAGCCVVGVLAVADIKFSQVTRPVVLVAVLLDIPRSAVEDRQQPRLCYAAHPFVGFMIDATSWQPLVNHFAVQQVVGHEPTFAPDICANDRHNIGNQALIRMERAS